MRISSVVPVWLLAVPLFLAALPAVAQSSNQSPPPAPPPADSKINIGGMFAKQPAARTVPDVPAPPMAWPRLDPGAVLCRTEDDLARRAAVLRGDPAGPADCRPITMPTAIQIVHRAGPGRTEVQLTGRTETGWTDAWLPAAPPPGTAVVQGGQLPGTRALSNQ